MFLTPEGEEFKEQIRPILDQVYVYAEKIVGIESIETMLSELNSVYDVLEKCIKKGAVLSSLFLAAQSINAQTDSLFLTVDQLFERGVQHSLQLQADAMRESMAQERTRTARSAQLPELQIGLKGGFVGQPVVWERGLSDPSYPEAPDWSQNYAIDLAQPLYQGGKIRSAIHKGGYRKASCRTTNVDRWAEIKLRLLNQYMNLV